MNKYKCPACKLVIELNDDRPTHYSYCGTKSKMVTLVKLKKVKK